jgi:hydrogenase maturation protease
LPKRGIEQLQTLVLGIGNLLMMDDGVGVRVAQALAENFIFPSHVKVMDGGTLGLDLLPAIEGMDRLMVIDAIDNGDQPGTLIRLEGDTVPMTLATKVSPHQMGLKDLLLVADLQGNTPSTIVLFGIQPACIDMGMELSPAVQASIQGLTDAVLAELEGWGISPLPI